MALGSIEYAVDHLGTQLIVVLGHSKCGAVTATVPFIVHDVHAQEMNLLPKYGALSKNDKQKAADAKFIATIDEQYKGNLKKAPEDTSLRGWKYFREGNLQDAMRRFNQAWLLDSTNGKALWGMATIQSNKGKHDEALKLFAEAERSIGNDIDFSVDHAKVIGIAGANKRSDALIQDAFARFVEIYTKVPQHVLNLQNWAITLFYVGNYAEAWKKIQIAEAAPRRADLDQNFIKTLESRAPRP